MLECGGDPNLLKEAFGTKKGRDFWPKDLDRYIAIVFEIARKKDDRSATTPNLVFDDIAAGNSSL
jgi:hypothetical protein